MRSAAETHVQIEHRYARDPKAVNMASAARRAAIYYYQLLLNEYPTWCAEPDTTDPAKSTGCADEALYHLALEQEREGDIAAALDSYSSLIRDWPASRFIPSAHLGVGELFFAESDKDPAKLGLAEKSYLKAIKHPPPDNAVVGYAHLQLGHVHRKRGRRAEAVKAFRAAMDWARSYPSAVGGGAVAAEAKEMLAELGAP